MADVAIGLILLVSLVAAIGAFFLAGVIVIGGVLLCAVDIFDELTRKE
jgi:hypothetical protein